MNFLNEILLVICVSMKVFLQTSQDNTLSKHPNKNLENFIIRQNEKRNALHRQNGIFSLAVV